MSKLISLEMRSFLFCDYINEVLCTRICKE